MNGGMAEWRNGRTADSGTAEWWNGRMAGLSNGRTTERRHNRIAGFQMFSRASSDLQDNYLSLCTFIF